MKKKSFLRPRCKIAVKNRRFRIREKHAMNSLIAKSQQRTEEIFALPCLRMDLKTKHVQGEGLPTPDDPKPIVDCTFVTGNYE